MILITNLAALKKKERERIIQAGWKFLPNQKLLTLER